MHEKCYSFLFFYLIVNFMLILIEENGKINFYLALRGR